MSSFPPKKTEKGPNNLPYPANVVMAFKSRLRPNFFSGKGSRKPLGARGGITSTLRRICTNFFATFCGQMLHMIFFCKLRPFPFG